MMNIQLNETIDGSEIDKKQDFGLQQSLENFYPPQENGANFPASFWGNVLGKTVLVRLTSF